MEEADEEREERKGFAAEAFAEEEAGLLACCGCCWAAGDEPPKLDVTVLACEVAESGALKPRSVAGGERKPITGAAAGPAGAVTAASESAGGGNP